MKKKAAWCLGIFAAGFLCGAVISHEVRLHSVPAALRRAESQSEQPRSVDRGRLGTMIASLVSDLMTIRSQLAMYRVQHEKYPDGADSVAWKAQLTQVTNANGEPGTDFGPYLSCFPVNPFNGSGDVLIDSAETDTPGRRLTSGPDACGWYFNTVTGRFALNDSVEHGKW